MVCITIQSVLKTNIQKFILILYKCLLVPVQCMVFCRFAIVHTLHDFLLIPVTCTVSSKLGIICPPNNFLLVYFCCICLLLLAFSLVHTISHKCVYFVHSSNITELDGEFQEKLSTIYFKHVSSFIIKSLWIFHTIFNVMLNEIVFC